MGLKLSRDTGFLIFGIGIVVAFFQADGMTPSCMEELKMLLHMYAPEVLNQVLVDFAAFLPFSD